MPTLQDNRWKYIKPYFKKRYIWPATVVLLVTGFFLLPSSFNEAPASTTIESREGRLLGAKIAADGQWRFPGAGRLPDKYKQSLVAFEDRRFYYHFGVDPLAIGRALIANLQQGKVVEGGSTISMQTVRLMRKGKRRTVVEKLIEAVLAVRLEVRYSKEKILELYARHAPFGGNVVGLDAAARRYFGRPADNLSWAESATLAVLPNAPALIHPGRNRERLLNKRNRLLAQLSAEGYFDAHDLVLAQAEPLPDKPLSLPAEAPHLLERLAKTNAGENIRTTLSYHLQQRAVEVVNRRAPEQRSNLVNNMAALIIENETGHVLAYVGNVTGRGSNEQGEMVDMVTAPRSTGSILKPFLYAAMFDEGTLLPATLVPDVPTYINGFVPQNFANSYDGAVNAHEALARSLNIPAVLMLQDYGLPRFYILLKKMGISAIIYSPARYGLSLILGGAEITLWDACNAYAAISRTANHFSRYNGRYNPNDWNAPALTMNAATVPVEERLDDHGLFSAAACWQLLEALAEVNRPEGEVEWKQFRSSRKVAWKTGTSFGHRDAWAIGTTPEYTIGVWVGNATGEGRPMLTGVTAAAPVMFDLFNLLPATTWYPQPFDEMTKVAVCRLSGHRATELCTATDSVWIVNAGLDSKPCPYHQEIHLDPTGRYRVNSDCLPPYRMLTRTWFVLPPAQEYFYKNTHHFYKPLPPMHPDCLNANPYGAMELLYPQNGFRIVLTRQRDGSTGRLIMQATHRRSDAVIHWHMDTAYLGTTTGQHQLPVLPEVGRHVVTLVDDEGNSLTGYFRVEDR